MQLRHASVTQTVAGSGDSRTVAEVAYTEGADTHFVFTALRQLGIGTPGPNVETALTKTSTLAGLPKGRSLNDPDWSEKGAKLWVLNKR